MAKVQSIYDRKSIRAKNPKQHTYINLIYNHTVIWALGASGTGKTYVPACIAADMLQDERTNIEKVILVRPAEGPGKSLGFLKGGLEEKLAPWLAPITDAMASRYGGGVNGDRYVKRLIETGKIEMLATEHSRGKTWNNAFVIIDEIQNLDWETLKNLTLRVGQDCKVVFCGDIKQTDIKGHSGLATIMRLEEEYHTPWKFIEFSTEDCVRSGVARFTLELYDLAGV